MVINGNEKIALVHRMSISLFHDFFLNGIRTILKNVYFIIVIIYIYYNYSLYLKKINFLLVNRIYNLDYTV